MMQVRIESERHGRATVMLDGQEAKGIRSLHLDMAAGEASTLTLEHITEVVEFEGDAQVFAMIDGRRYRLIEGESP